MKTTLLLAGLMFVAANAANTAYAQAPSTSEAGKSAAAEPAAKSGGKASCDQVKQDVEAKLTAHGVKQFTVQVVDNAQDASGKVVGHCDGGARKLVYSKEAAAK